MKTRYGKILIKSDRAIAAEEDGRYPASRIATILGIPSSFVAQHVPWDGEWHHVSKFANEISYYDLVAVREWLQSDEGQTTYQLWKDRRRARKTTTYQNVTVEWLAWSGSFRHPRSTQCEASGCEVIDSGGAFVEVKLPDGKTFRKKKTTRGFAVIVGGETVSFDSEVTK